MAAGEQGHQQPLHNHVLTDDHLGDVRCTSRMKRSVSLTFPSGCSAHGSFPVGHRTSR